MVHGAWAMTILDQVLVLLAGVGAGTINTIVGSGTLITFPVLVLLGVPPLTANVSNTVGLVPGAVSGAVGYRRELRGQRRGVVVLGAAGGVGGLTGALLLLALPSEAFDTIVPVLIVLALVAVVAQPWLARQLGRRRAARTAEVRNGGAAAEAPAAGSGPGERIPWALRMGVAGTGVYGGYFGAAQGVLLLALLGIAMPDDLQRNNALKNVIAAVVNGVAAVLFIVVADVDWRIAALVAAGSVVGGQIGATVGRRMPPRVLRAAIVVIGLVAVVRLV